VTRARPGPLARAAIGIAISLAAMAVAVRGVNLEAAGAALRQADWRWVAVMLACICTDVTCRAIRWRALVRPIKDVPTVRMIAYYLIGILANNILPARLGELVRSHYLGDREHVSRTSVLGTVVVERVVDAAVLVALAAGAILVLGVRGAVAGAVLVGVVLTAALIGALALALVAHRLPYADRVIAAASRWPTLTRLAGRLRGGLAVVQRPRTVGLAVAWSLAGWGAIVASVVAAGQALGVDLSWSQAALVGAGASLATAIPAGPGSLGTFELAAVTILAAFGIAPDAAFALAVLVHSVNLVATSVGGAVALLKVGWRRSPADAPAGA
jgi:uncharacterized protein (TIRG00374 family)